MKRWLIVWVMAGAAASAAAQEVWRCGADGRQFQSTPCADGRTVALASGPSPAAVQEARAVLQRERQALSSLAHERQARERGAVAAPAGIKPAPRPAGRPKPAEKLPLWRSLPAA